MNMKKEKESRKYIGFYVDEEKYEKIKELSREEGIFISQALNFLIDEAIDRGYIIRKRAVPK